MADEQLSPDLIDIPKSTTENEKLRSYLNNLISQLDYERSSFVPTWMECSELLSPTRERFFVTDTQRGSRRNQSIIDSSATRSSKILSAGIMSGMTSPSRPWFRLTTPDPDLADYQPVKEYLYIVEQRMRAFFLKSNLYNQLPLAYRDCGNFGTSFLSLEENFDSVIHTNCFPIGSYYLMKDYLGRVNGFARVFKLTTEQIISKFCPRVNGKLDTSNISEKVVSDYKAGKLATNFIICHVVMPNPEYDPDKLESRYKKFVSYYWELGGMSIAEASKYLSSKDVGRFLRIKGYDYFPGLGLRWEVTGEDVYGTDCPGITSIGDIKQLQYGEKATGQAIDQKIKPALVGHPNLKTEKVSLLPGTITYLDESTTNGRGLRPLLEANLSIGEMENKQAQIRQRIKANYHEDLFLQMSQLAKAQTTAREIDERHEEKYLILGPVIQQFDQDVLTPLIDNAFMIGQRQDQFPTPPKELQGMQLKVEYISIMAQAQKALGISSIERFVGFVGNVAKVYPNVTKKLHAYHVIDEYSDSLGISPKLLVPNETIEAQDAAEAQAAANQSMIQNLQSVSMAAKNLSQAGLENDNALKRIAGA